MTNPNQLLENWEKDFENLAASLLLQGINIRHIVKFKLSFEEYVKNLLRQQEAKTREEDAKLVMRGHVCQGELCVGCDIASAILSYTNISEEDKNRILNKD